MSMLCSLCCLSLIAEPCCSAMDESSHILPQMSNPASWLSVNTACRDSLHGVTHDPIRGVMRHVTRYATHDGCTYTPAGATCVCACYARVVDGLLIRAAHMYASQDNTAKLCLYKPRRIGKSDGRKVNYVQRHSTIHHPASHPWLDLHVRSGYGLPPP